VIRMIKRYGSRKLYDTEESRYVSLEEIGAWVRGGQEIRVIDNSSSEDVTAQTLAQVILEMSRRGEGSPPSELLHELIQRGGELVSNGVGQIQHGVDRLLQASIDRVGPLRKAREETVMLRRRLDDLESSLRDIELRMTPRGTADSNDHDESGTDAQTTGSAKAKE